MTSFLIPDVAGKLLGRVQISRILVFPNGDSWNRHEAKNKWQRLREFSVMKGELLAVEEGIRES